MNDYLGNPLQLSGVEEYRLVGGRKDNMTLLSVKNGKGLELHLSMSRASDISRLYFKGNSLGYFSPCGYVHPSYYDDRGNGFLKSFTAGFLTTCGLASVGKPCNDNGEELPLHGRISNTPCNDYCYYENEEEIIVEATVIEECIFSYKLVLNRTIKVSKKENTFTINDVITNRGDTSYPTCILYHMNMGYPLLSEKSVLDIPSSKVLGRTELAQKEIDEWNKIIKPTSQYEERCYYHYFDKERYASIYNPDINTRLTIAFSDNLKYFTEWKMMGKRDYVLGLEPGNAHPDGRDILRKENALTILKPNESVSYQVKVTLKEE